MKYVEIHFKFCIPFFPKKKQRILLKYNYLTCLNISELDWMAKSNKIKNSNRGLVTNSHI